MKIAIICYNHFDATISLGKHMIMNNKDVEVEYIFLMSKSSLNVEILDLNRHSYKLGFNDPKTVSQILGKEIKDYLTDDIKVNIFLFNSIKIADHKNVKLLFTLKREISKKKYDVIHMVGNNRWIVFLNLLLRKFPRVHTLHEPYPFTKIPAYRLLRSRWKINLLLHSGSHLIIPSRISYERLIQHFHIRNGEVSIIPFGIFEIYKEYLKENIPKEKDTILYYGNISEYKGIDVLLEAMGSINKTNPDLKLTIAGGGKFPYSISGKNIQLINRHLSNKEIASLNTAATIVVCPYTSASQSGVVMTSFAFDNPIVATNVGALPEVIENGQTGIIIDPSNPEALSHAILSLFAHPATIEKMRENIKSSFNHKNWADIADRTVKLYNNQIEKNQMPKSWTRRPEISPVPTSQPNS